MIHTFIGEFGSTLVNTAFVFAILTAISYYNSSKQADPASELRWMRLARFSFIVHSLAVFGVVYALFTIVNNHYYEYHYAFNHSSNNLPKEYVIASFWNGQEGSFLLWIFWHVILGLLLLKLAKKWEQHVMIVFALVQAFLVSMILGVVVFDAIKIGSSPFMLMRDISDAPIFKMNPEYVPADGSGLNPLLQNYWMVIHPPTLFLGFATTLVPFAFCIAGLWTGRFKEWVKPALAWSHFAAVVLGVGIMMGAYWAYETLNFGGYWNWDPVENAVYVPWLILVAAIHVMMTFRKNDRALKAAMILVISSFVLILYSTFLTRSGVLGEASVHSFTDLGLSGQLLLYMLFFLAMSVWLLAVSWNKIPVKSDEVEVYSREFWIFIGATVLCLAGFQVLVPTSIPAYNAFLGFFGIESNMAPPADQVGFYTKYQFWFGVAIAFLSGTGQFFFWKKMDKSKLRQVLYFPVLLTLGISALSIIVFKVHNLAYILLLTAGIYSIVSNTIILIKLAKVKVKLAGGAVAHIGVALMLIGILFSSGYSKVISLNMSGRIYSSEFPDEVNRENLLLFRNHPKQMQDYILTYKGPRMDSRNIPGYIDKEALMPTENPARVIAKKDIVQEGQTYAKRGDTIHVYNENTYYEVEFRHNNGKVFTLYPRVQDNPQMGLAYSPDVNIRWNKDLYSHLTTMAVDDEEVTWSEPETYELQIGDTIIVNDYIAILDNVSRTDDLLQVALAPGDVAVKANLRVMGLDTYYDLEPVFVIKNNSVGIVPSVNRDLGIRTKLEKIEPETATFTLSVETTQRDWVILKAIEKPYISLLWIGTILMSIGFGIASYRRFTEFNKEQNESGKRKPAKKGVRSARKEVVSN